MKNLKEMICYIAILILVSLSVMLPPSGKTALLDETCEVLIIWVAVCYAFWKIIKKQKTEKNQKMPIKISRTIITIILILIGALFSSSLIIDLYIGPQTLTLDKVKVSNFQGYSGIFSHHYYLYGEDSSNTMHRIEISNQEYQKLKGQKEITIRYYKHTRRLYHY